MALGLAERTRYTARRARRMAALPIRRSVWGLTLLVALTGCSTVVFGQGVAITNQSGSSGSAAGGWVRYADSSGLSFLHPAQWTVEPSTRPASKGALFVFIDPPSSAPHRRNLNILLQRSDPPYTMSSYLKLAHDQIQSYPNHRIYTEGPTTLSGFP